MSDAPKMNKTVEDRLKMLVEKAVHIPKPEVSMLKPEHEHTDVRFTLKRTGKFLECGCEELRLFLVSTFGVGSFTGSRQIWLDIPACSGQPYAQTFRRAGDDGNISGNMEPLPQGKYSVGSIEWASGKNVYEGSWGEGLGPVYVAVSCDDERKRGGFGIHLDANRDTSPGTAGCIGILTLDDLQELVGALRRVGPRELEVDWGL